MGMGDRAPGVQYWLGTIQPSPPPRAAGQVHHAPSLDHGVEQGDAHIRVVHGVGLHGEAPALEDGPGGDPQIRRREEALREALHEPREGAAHGDVDEQQADRRVFERVVRLQIVELVGQQRPETFLHTAAQGSPQVLDLPPPSMVSLNCSR